MLAKAVLKLLLLALGISIWSIYVSKSPMLEGVRRWFDNQNPWMGYALKCAFCVAGWTALFLNSIYDLWLLDYLFDALWNIRGVNLFAPLNFTASWFSLWGLSTLFYRLFWPFLEKHAPKMKIHLNRH